MTCVKYVERNMAKTPYIKYVGADVGTCECSACIKSRGLEPQQFCEVCGAIHG